MANCSVLDVAQWFIAKTHWGNAGESVTHLKLHKLIYYAQAWHLANYDKPLFDDPIEAWSHGPIVRDVWDELQEYTWQALPPVDFPKLSLDVFEFLDEVYKAYSDLGAKTLEDLVKSEDPWKEARGTIGPQDRSESLISHDHMKEYYGNQIR